MIPYKGKKPKIHRSAYIAMHSAVAGDVQIGEHCGIWFGAVIRGDVNHIVIGNGTNIQDNSTVHVGHNNCTIIGENVTVGHNCVVHGCTIEEHVIVGMGSTILDGAHISKNTIIGANSLVTMNKTYPEGVMLMGSPAKVVRDLTPQEIEQIKESAKQYIQLAKDYTG